MAKRKNIFGWLRPIFSRLSRHSFRLGVIMGIMVAGFFIERTIYADPSFLLRHVSVQTTGRLSDERIAAWSGLQKGMRIFDVRLDAVERRLVRHPEVKLAHVTRVMPNRVHIFVSERRAFMQVAGKADGKPFWCLDEEGFVVPSLWPKASRHLPLVVIPELSGETLDIGEKYSDPKFAALKRLIRAISDSTSIHWDDVNYIVVWSESEYRIQLQSGITVITQDRFSEGLEKLSSFSEAIRSGQSDIQYIDTRFTDVAVGRKK